MNYKREYDLAVQLAVLAIAADFPQGVTLRMNLIREGYPWFTASEFEMHSVARDYGNERTFYAFLNGDPVVYARVYKRSKYFHWR